MEWKINKMLNIELQEKNWWKEAVVYQIYPRSFMDSNGDGIGDLNGIISKLDYIKQLGVNVIWLSPHFDSPNADNGYDIRDYRKIMPSFGDMKNFDDMLAGIKSRGMKLIIDLVVNHTSDEHEWFIESRKSKDNPYRDFYIWRDAQADGSPPNNYPSFFGGSAWEWDEKSEQYYLHYFAKKQPDLNWENPKVREAVYDIMHFWLSKGVDGFRMDVIPFISKQDGFPDLTREQLNNPEFVYANGPRIHQYLQEMNELVLSKYDVMTVGEAFGINFDSSSLFTDSRRKELNMIFHFDLVRVGRDNWRETGWTLPELKSIVQDIDNAANSHSWNTSFLCNHDNPRIVSHFGDESEASAKAYATMMLTLRGTPFIYQGDELGMTNFPFECVEQYDDIEVKGTWEALVETGKVDADCFLQNFRRTSRDHARTPMQWTSEYQGGFTSGSPWLAVNPNYQQINAEKQLGIENSVYHFYRQLIQIRADSDVLIYGSFEDLDIKHSDIFIYQRVLNKKVVLIVINLSVNHVEYVLPKELKIEEQILNSSLGTKPLKEANTLELEPWQACIFNL